MFLHERGVEEHVVDAELSRVGADLLQHVFRGHGDAAGELPDAFEGAVRAHPLGTGEEQIELGPGIDQFLKDRRVFRHDPVVHVDEGDVLSADTVETRVPGRRDALRLEFHHGDGETLGTGIGAQEGQRGVLRAVIDEDEFEVLRLLRTEHIDHGADESLPVIDRDDH